MSILIIIEQRQTWQNQQSGCASSEDSDQPGHPPSLIRVFAVRMKKPWGLSYPLSAQRRLWSTLWSDWANAQADLSLCWAHTHFVGFVMSWLICINTKTHIKEMAPNDRFRFSWFDDAITTCLPFSLCNCKQWNVAAGRYNKMSLVMRKPVYAICEQQRRRSTCASAQSDQHLCCSLPR